MSMFKTTKEQICRVYTISATMACYLPADFVLSTIKLACHSQGVYDLMELWIAESDPDERKNIIVAIQSIIDEEEVP